MHEYCKKYGWDIPAQCPSAAITGFQTSDTAERRIFKGLIEAYDTYIMPCGKPGFYRVSHMGLQTDEELRLLAERIHEFEKQWRKSSLTVRLICFIKGISTYWEVKDFISAILTKGFFYSKISPKEHVAMAKVQELYLQGHNLFTI